MPKQLLIVGYYGRCGWVVAACIGDEMHPIAGARSPVSIYKIHQNAQRLAPEYSKVLGRYGLRHEGGCYERDCTVRRLLWKLRGGKPSYQEDCLFVTRRPWWPNWCGPYPVPYESRRMS